MYNFRFPQAIPLAPPKADTHLGELTRRPPTTRAKVRAALDQVGLV